VLFELEDKAWFPNELRTMQTQYIGWLVKSFGLYRDVIPLLKKHMPSNTHCIQDLCSGSGDPLIYVKEQLDNSDLHFFLSDLYPPANPRELEVHYRADSIDALKVRATGGTFYTMFNALHHFNAEQRAQLMQQLGTSGFMFAEILQPRIFDALKIAFVTTLGQLFLAPFVKPFRIKRLLYTYVLPINLMTIFWDGMVSVLRAISHRQLEQELKRNCPEHCVYHLHRVGPFWARFSVGFILPLPKD